MLKVLLSQKMAVMTPTSLIFVLYHGSTVSSARIMDLLKYWKFASLGSVGFKKKFSKQISPCPLCSLSVRLVLWACYQQMQWLPASAAASVLGAESPCAWLCIDPRAALLMGAAFWLALTSLSLLLGPACDELSPLSMFRCFLEGISPLPAQGLILQHQQAGQRPRCCLFCCSALQKQHTGKLQTPNQLLYITAVFALSLSINFWAAVSNRCFICKDT